MVWNTETILIVFVGLTGFAVLLQACVLLAIYLSLKKTAQSALDATEDFKSTVLPIVHSTRELLERITPQVLAVSTSLVQLTEMLKQETHGVSFSAREIMQRVDRQSQRLDAMLTSGLNTVDRVALVVESAVAAPVRQVNGIVAAVKAVVDTYRSEVPRRKSRASGAGNGSGI